MGAAEVPQIQITPERRGLFGRLAKGQSTNDGNRVTGTPWVASPFLRWGALGVAFISFSALLGYSALPNDADAAAAPSLSFFAVYLTDDPLPAELEGLVVSIARVGAGDPDSARSLDLRVKSFDISRHQGVNDAIPVATGYVLPENRDKVFIEFEAAVGLRGDEQVPLQVSERFLHVEYDSGSLADRAAVLLDIDLERSVQEVDMGAGRFLRFVPTVAEVYSEPLPPSVETVPVGEPIPSSEPLFASAVPMPPLKQYRSSSAPISAPTSPVSGLADAAGAPLGADDKDATPSPRSSTPTYTTAPRTTTKPPSTSQSASTSTSAPPTLVNEPPATPRSPNPSSGAQNVDTETLAWQGGEDEDAVSFEMFLSEANPPPITQPSCATYERSCHVSLDSGTTYYWRVRAVDANGGVTLGPVWSFRTAETMCDRVNLATACPV